MNFWLLLRILRSEKSKLIAEIKKTLQDFIYNENICGEWKKVDGKNDKFDGKFGSYNLDYIEYQECTYGTFYKVSEEFRFYHTAFNLYDANDQPSRFFYIYNPDTTKWVRFFPDFREFKRDPMPAEMRQFLLTIVDYIIPVESGYILITGKNFEGEDRSRLIAGTSLLIETGLSFTVVGKGFYKAGKGALKAGTNAIKNSKVTQKTIEVASETFKKGKKIIKGAKVNKKLLQSLNLLKNSDTEIANYVTDNIGELSQNYNTIWEMTSSVTRGRVWEHVRKLTDLKNWEFIGGQNQRLLDFFYNKNGIIMQQKSIGLYVQESTLNTYKGSFAKIIDELDKVVKAKKYVVQGGKELAVKNARLDIVIPKELDISDLKNYLENYITQRKLDVKVLIVIK